MAILPITSLDDPRVGTKAMGDTPAVHPEFDLNGQPYTKPATVYSVPSDRTRFVVIPPGYFKKHTGDDLNKLFQLDAPAVPEPEPAALEDSPNVPPPEITAQQPPPDELIGFEPPPSRRGK